ncbi:hypothetical protein EV426DRAFT_702035 [Tirmania nivea]|nr:hypothetical protein EV426DRAFT_702035 [Tirmania nivea]
MPSPMPGPMPAQNLGILVHSTDHLRIFAEWSTSLILADINSIVNMAYWIDTILLENWSGFLLVLDQIILSLFLQHGKLKKRSHFMLLHALPLLDLWFAANVRANVQTVAANAKKKVLYVLLIAILAQIIHVLIQFKY